MGRNVALSWYLLPATLGMAFPAALGTACGGQGRSGSVTADAGGPEVASQVVIDATMSDAPAAEGVSDGQVEDGGSCLSVGTSRDAAPVVSPPLEAGACENGWLTSDPGCPCDLSGFLTYCSDVGMRCAIPATGGAGLLADQLCVGADAASALMPLWEQTIVYTPDGFAALPNEIDLDASDCAERAILPCTCGTSATTEGFIGNQGLSRCTYNNPPAYVEFTDAGCALRIRYGSGLVPDASYAACLTAGYASRRWACASSGTHLAMLQTTPPLGGP